MADREHGVAMTEHSVFPLASLSKQYWATAIAQLVEDGRLAGDYAVADILAAFPDRRVTVGHLLTQTSGLGDDAPAEDDITFRDFPKLAFDPGAGWLYSNRGALLARRIVEQVTGAPFERQLRDRIAAPLHLASTRICGNDHVALYRDGKPWSDAAAELARLAFVCSDAVDVARFERSFDVGGLLRPASVAAMRRPTMLDGVSVPYGWFTRIGDLDGRVAYGHTGGMPGVSVAAFRFPADDLTVVVLANTEPERGFKAHDVLLHVARAELHLVEPAMLYRPMSQTELDAIAGTYTSGPQRVTVSARDGKPWIVITVGDKRVWEGALAPVGGRSFAGGPDGARADEVARFEPATGKATMILVGHRLLLEAVFARDR
jgi:CubicO group peptidase (beta-lactamase class C family)